jgi:hypothetical protein
MRNWVYASGPKGIHRSSNGLAGTWETVLGGTSALSIFTIIEDGTYLWAACSAYGKIYLYLNGNSGSWEQLNINVSYITEIVEMNGEYYGYSNASPNIYKTSNFTTL